MRTSRLTLALAVLLAGCERIAPASGEAEPAAAVAALSEPAEGRAFHLVRLVARGDRYDFEPAELRIRSGEVVRFIQTGHQPESVAFDSATTSAEGARFLAVQRLLAGPLLTEPGAFFDVAFADAPPGTYEFFSVPHRTHGMVGRVIVEP